MKLSIAYHLPIKRIPDKVCGAIFPSPRKTIVWPASRLHLFDFFIGDIAFHRP